MRYRIEFGTCFVQSFAQSRIFIGFRGQSAVGGSQFLVVVGRGLIAHARVLRLQYQSLLDFL